MKIEDMQMNPFTKIGKEWGLVSAGTLEKCNTMTVSWGGVGVLWNKNVVFVFIRESRYTKEFIDNGETFSLSFLDQEKTKDVRKKLSFLGTESGRDFDKWKETGLTPAEKCGVVYPEEASTAFLCRKMAAIPFTPDQFIDDTLDQKWYSDHDMHTLYIGEILEVV